MEDIKMKTWNNPVIEELGVKATEYDPAGGTKVDGTYNSYDGKYSFDTYGPSTGNNGEPEVVVYER